MQPFQPLPRSILILGFAAFFLIGLEQSLFGPAFSALNGRFALEPGAVGSVVTSHFLGVTVGTLVSGVILSRLRVRGVALLSSVACGVGLLLVGVAPSWILALLGAFLSGLGFGGISGGFGTLFSSRGRGGSAALSLINAFWGVGSIVGPLLANRLLERGLNLYFGSAAALFGGLVVAVLILRFPLGSSAMHTPAGDSAKSATAPVFWPLVPFMLMLCCYSGLEVSGSSWMVTYLRQNIALEAANTVNSLFWVMLTLGRFLTAPLSLKLSPGQLVLGSSVLALLSVVFIGFPASSPYAYAALGLFCAPIFPMGLAWFASRYPDHVGFTPLVIGSSSLGAALLPAFTGWGVGALGLSSIPLSLSLIGILLLGMALFNTRSGSARAIS